MKAGNNYPQSYTAERNRIIRQRYAQGKTIREIAEEFNMSYAWCNQIILRNPPAIGGLKVKHREVMKLTDEGYSAKQIADKLGYSIYSVYNIRKDWRKKYE